MAKQEKHAPPADAHNKYPKLVESLRILLDKNYFIPDPQRAMEYLHRDHSRNFSNGDVQIPIGKKDWVRYYGDVVGGTSDRPIRDYQEALFPDVFRRTEFTQDATYSIENFLREQDKLENPQPVFTGFEDAFKPENVVLDVASGEAVGAMQLALKFPQTTIIGVDILYQNRRKAFPDKPGLQLLHADWRTLEGVPTASVDTILSLQGIAMWGLPFAGDSRSQANNIPVEDGIKTVQALKRVSKPGTVIRFDRNRYREFLREHLGSNWLIHDRDDVFIARRER